jgi:hypothetical protein
MMKTRCGKLMVLMMSVSVLTLGGCGVRPAGVDAPASVQNDSFPNTYPDASTDPVPR